MGVYIKDEKMPDTCVECFKHNKCDRWATRKQQANNRHNSLMVTIDGVTKTLSEWADFAGIPFKTINSRYHDKGIRGVMLLHRVEDTKFKNGYNRYANPKHYDDYVIEAEVE